MLKPYLSYLQAIGEAYVYAGDEQRQDVAPPHSIADIIEGQRDSYLERNINANIPPEANMVAVRAWRTLTTLNIATTDKSCMSVKSHFLFQSSYIYLANASI